MKLYLLWEEAQRHRYLLGVFSTLEKGQAHRPGEWERVEGVANTWTRSTGKRARADRFWIEIEALDDGKFS